MPWNKDRMMRGGPPPWWPENEPWPPADWRTAQRMFLRRLGCFLVVLALIIFVLPVFVVGLFTGFDVPSHRPSGGPPPFIGIIGVIVLVAVGIWIVQKLRSTASTIGEVMGAADRVAGGDYDVRISEDAPHELGRLAKSFNEMTARLAAAERQRRGMQADIAHEMRTPLSVIQGTVEGMIDGVYPRDDLHLESILEKSSVMARLLEDLQTLSLAEAGVLALYRESTDLTDLIDGVIADFRPEAEQQGIELASQTPETLEVEIDPIRIRQVLDNLIRNALRHTPRGGSIGIEIRQLSQEVECVVADTGTGIDPAHLPSIFDRFTKSSDSGGSGLGLAIARRLVEAHGGQIRASSEPGKGTTITFALPLS
jgi:signal transduction histidine kinase